MQRHAIGTTLLIQSIPVQRALKQDVCWHNLHQAALRKPFADESMQFCQQLSQALLRPTIAKAFPELAALGFWLRKSNLQSIAAKVTDQKPTTGMRLFENPRGTVFHIAPANVDTIFVYSWILSLLCGNRNLIRLSSKVTDQLSMLLETVDECLALDSSRGIRESIAVIRYDHSESITSELCKSIDVRIGWGGDDTVNAIREIPMPPTAIEACFPNKVSLALLDFKFWKEAVPSIKSKIAREFAMDAFQFGQSACSSPRALVWIGSNIQEVEKTQFWSLVLEAMDKETFDFKEIDYLNKLIASDLAATRFPVRIHSGGDNRVVRLTVSPADLRQGIESDLHCGNGLFFETELDSLDDLQHLLSRKSQTLTYAGFEANELSIFIESCVPNGIDRIVPFGQALDFSHIWDGMDLLDVFLRKTSVVA